MEEKIGSTIIARRLNEELPGSEIKKDQIRKVLKYFKFTNKITEKEYSQIKDFYKNHSKKEIKNILTEATSTKKYGVKNPAQSKEIRETLRNNYLQKSEEEKEKIKEKRKETNQKLFGTDYFNQSQERIEYCKKHWKNNIEKGKETCKERYGVESYSKTIEFREKFSEFQNSEKGKIARQKARESWDKKTEKEKKEISKKAKEKHFQNLKEEKENLEITTDLKLFSLKEISEFLDRDFATLLNFVKESNLRIVKGKYRSYLSEKDFEFVKKDYEKRKIQGTSSKEKSVLDFVKSIYNGEIIENSKKILGKKELDIFLPEKNLAIEFNGLFWHSDIDMRNYHNVPTEEEKEFTKYRHLKKTELCEEKGIHLIHIFEDDWDFKREIIEDILKQSLGICDKKIFARKCTLQKINADTYKRFLEENHLQGYSPADLKLGLFYENELVELIGVNTKGTHSKEPELVRLCSKTGVNVIGGFSKLLKHTELSHLVSYIDRATFSGGGYEKAGFTKIKENPPVYFYVKPGKYEKIPRYVFMRKHIEEKFKKGELKYWNPNETEEINMYKNGFGRIWNCGTIKVEWRQSN